MTGRRARGLCCGLMLAGLLIQAGCVHVPARPLSNGGSSVETALDPARITLASWNIEKGGAPNWPNGSDGTTLTEMFAGADLVLLQEVCAPDDHRASPLTSALAAGRFGWVFAASFRAPLLGCGSGRATGVLTAAAARPAARQALVSRHRELGLTPKTSLVTVYRLAGQAQRQTGRAQRLMVVNVHLLNFEWLDLDDYRDQLAAIAERIADHDGPLIVAGDMNTRNTARQQAVDALAGRAGLRPVFGTAEDGRTRALIGGDLPLDHVYYRGLKITRAGKVGDEADAGRSDHNSLRVTFTTDGPRVSS